MNKLRSYQQEAIDKMKWALTLEGNSIVSLPQGSGKTHVISGFVDQTNLPILILVQNKELLEQDLEKLEAVVSREEIGIFSASMNEKSVKRYTLATIQSAYKNPEKFQKYRAVIVDECDRVPIKDLSSMYMGFFREIGNPKVFGLTATPFRQDVYYEYPGGWDRYQGKAWQRKYIESVTTTKMINRYKGNFWARIIYCINTDELVKRGYLSPIKYIDKSMIKHQQLKLNKTKSDFDLEDFDKITKPFYPTIGQFIEQLPHKSSIIYCSSIEQAEAISELVSGSLVVTSKTTKKKREKAIQALRSGELKYLFNVSIFTIGFDYPELESLVLLRPTRSLPLHLQILGRVSRIAEGKEFGYVYDLVNNVASLGKLAETKVVKLSDGWNVVSDSVPEGFHLKPLYRFRPNRG
jgi:DNA repair protein RadD